MARLAEQPAYRRLAAELRERILDGRLRPGAVLPAESDLAFDHDVGAGTVRQSLAMLEGEGLIDRQAGARARVRRTAASRVVELAPGAVAVVRRATEAERAELRLPAGGWLVEVDDGGEVTLYPADGLVLQAPPPD